MTSRISLCINGNTHYGIKPWPIADISNGTLIQAKVNVNVKTENQLKLIANRISVWDWDDNINNYLLNKDVTDEYQVVEVIAPDWKLKGKNRAEIQDEARAKLELGIVVNASMQPDLRLFVKVEETKDGVYGILLDHTQYALSNGTLKLNADVSELSRCFGKYSYVEKSNLMSTLLSMVQKERTFGLIEHFETVNERFPLPDLIKYGKKIVEEYIVNPGVRIKNNFTEDQIDSILNACRNDFSSYSENAGVDIDGLFADTDLSKKLYKSIAGITNETEFVERFLQKQDGFKSVCCNAVREEALSSCNAELGEIKSEVGRVTQEVKELEGEKKRLEKEADELNTLIDKNRVIKEQHDVLVTELEDKKRAFINGLVGQALHRIISEGHGSRELYFKTFPAYSDADSVDEREFENTLHTNLSCCLSGERIEGLSNFIVAAIRSGKSIIVCNDSMGIISECISAAIDCRPCSKLCVTGTAIDPSYMVEIETKTVAVEGALASFDFRPFFLFNRTSDKVMIFHCDDRAIIDAAPTEMWAFSVLIDLSNYGVKTTNTKLHRMLSKEALVALKAKKNSSATVPQKMGELLSVGAITKNQYYMLLDLGSAICEPNFISNSFFREYLKQIVKGNHRIPLFEKVFTDE